ATTVFAGLDAEGVLARVAALRQAQLEPTAVVALRGEGGRYDLGLRFEGFGPGVEQQVARAGGERSGDDFWARHDAVRTGGALRVKVAALRSRLPAVDALAARLGGAFAWYATLGVGFAAGALVEMEPVRAALVAAGGSLIVETVSEIEPWGPPPPSFPLMQAL